MRLNFRHPLSSPEDYAFLKMLSSLLNKIGHLDAVSDKMTSHICEALILIVKRLILQALNEAMTEQVDTGLKMTLGILSSRIQFFESITSLSRMSQSIGVIASHVFNPIWNYTMAPISRYVRVRKLLECDGLTLESMSCVAITLHDEKRYDVVFGQILENEHTIVQRVQLEKQQKLRNQVSLR